MQNSELKRAVDALPQYLAVDYQRDARPVWVSGDQVLLLSNLRTAYLSAAFGQIVADVVTANLPIPVRHLVWTPGSAEGKGHWAEQTLEAKRRAPLVGIYAIEGTRTNGATALFVDYSRAINEVYATHLLLLRLDRHPDPALLSFYRHYGEQSLKLIVLELIDGADNAELLDAAQEHYDHYVREFGQEAMLNSRPALGQKEIA
jgi:hypothetical protein